MGSKGSCMEGLVYKGDLLSEEATVLSMVDELMTAGIFRTVMSMVDESSQLQSWFWFWDSRVQAT